MPIPAAHAKALPDINNVQHSDARTAGYRLGLVLVTAAAVAWSLAGLFTRLIPLDTWTTLTWRGIFGTVGVAVLDGTMRRKEAWRDLGRLGWSGWLYAVVGSLCMILYITALRHTTVAHVAVIGATVPFFAAALAWFMLREKPSVHAVVTSLAALVGVVVMVGLSTQGSLFGDALAVATTLAMASIMVIVRRFQSIPAVTAAGVAALLSGIICIPFSQTSGLTATNLTLLALFGLVNSAAGLALFNLGARLLPTMETALIGSLEAPLAPLWVWWVFSEIPSTSALVGGTIVFVAVTIHLITSARNPSPELLAAERHKTAG